MEDYSSEFEYDSDVDKKRKKRQDLTEKSAPAPSEPSTSIFKRPKNFSQPTNYTAAVDREASSVQRFHLLGLDAYARHKLLINEYLLTVPGSTKILQRDTSRDRTDLDVIRENQKFLWDEDDDTTAYTWEQRLARKYYDKLFKEYCIVDLRAYKQNKFGMRWRTEKEVVDGKGQFVCGSKHCLNHGTNLKSWEVNFAYTEEGAKKNALVKLRLCPDCSKMLNYTTRHKEASRRKSLPPIEIKQEPASTPERPTAPTELIDTTPVLTDEQVREQEKAVWEKPVLPSDDKSRHQEFDEYFSDMLL
ncbi:Protein FRA10AC1-like protein [Hypsibius exemplaris]|uniref:Protein FRA10AC1-like protein n=1 Tax=Hypsibius exemplaris TaxID=2072580 RepID=A0A1W0XAL8_HYPEX|nr:Protein FRA10AC1-like protein [Hypsibius exemplaris]